MGLNRASYFLKNRNFYDKNRISYVRVILCFKVISSDHLHPIQTYFVKLTSIVNHEVTTIGFE